MGACSVGKDSIINELKNKYGYEVCVSSTTRPKRSNEINGKDYHFISDSEFLQKLNNNELLEMREYKTAHGLWWYGLDKKAVDISKNQLVILDAKGYKTVVEALGEENVLGIYVYTTEREKIVRALNREPNREDNEFYMELFRRITDDMTAFNGVINDDKVYKIQNKDGEFDKTIKEIVNIINNNTSCTSNKLDDLEVGDKVKIIDILNKGKASHLLDFKNKDGYVFSWIIVGKEKRYKVLFDEKGTDTAYFRRNELLKIEE